MGSANHAQEVLSMSMASSVTHTVTGKAIEYRYLMKDPNLNPLWDRGLGNEVARLFQGPRDIEGTSTCFFIELNKIPKGKTITNCKIVCDLKPHKKEEERIRLIVGGDKLDYLGELATPTADITTSIF
jgi:hypothetical protein